MVISIPNKTAKDIENTIIQDYKDGYGTNFLSDKYQLHRSTIQRILKRNNIILRNGSPYNHYNINFFDQYNPESVYWAGFICADGYIRDDRDAISIHLCNADNSHLYKIKELTKYEGNISNSNNECSITFSGKWYSESLLKNYSLTPRKAHIVEINNNIPIDMLCHYIRGIFDGDGCIYDLRGYPAISFSSSSEKMLNGLIKIFKEQVGIQLQTKDKQPKINGIQICYTCDNAMKILDWMYKSSVYLTRLDRKYNKYLSYVNKRYEKKKYTQDIKIV